MIWTLYLREQRYEDPLLFFEAKKSPRAKTLGKGGLADFLFYNGTYLQSDRYHFYSLFVADRFSTSAKKML
jgi:hypothetical protein